MGVSLVSNPPYNMAWNVPDLAGFMPQYQGFTIPPKQNANYAFVMAALYMVDGKAAFLLPNGVMTASTKEETQIRQQMVSGNLISAVITLPDSMFESTSIPVCIVLFEKNRQTRKIEMVDLRNSYETEIRDQRGQYGGESHTGRTYHKEVKVITEETMQMVIKAIQDHESVQGICCSVLPEEIAKNDYNLVPARYIEQVPIEEKHRSYEDIANDYNRIIKQKNLVKIRMNKTAAKRLGYDCMNIEKPDLTESFAVVGQKALKEEHIRFSADDGIEIKCSTKDGIPELILLFLNNWKQRIMYLNNEENRLLAEFRDALLPDLMNGKIEVKEL